MGEILQYYHSSAKHENTCPMEMGITYAFTLAGMYVISFSVICKIFVKMWMHASYFTEYGYCEAM